MLFSKTTEYAVRILTYMQIKDEMFFSATKLYTELDLPYKYITKLMTTLSKADLIKTKMGRSGGYYLARAGEEIFLKHIILATNDFKKLDSCVLGHSKCSDQDPCAMHNKWVPIKETIINMTNSLNLDELAKIDITKL